VSFDSEILKKTLRTMENVRRDRSLELRRRTFELFEKFPRLSEIDSERKLLGLSIAGNVLSGGDSSAGLKKIRKKSEALRAEQETILTDNGFPPDCLDDKPVCTKCGDLYYIGSTPCECLMKAYRTEQSSALSDLFRVGPGNFCDFDLSLYSDKPFENYPYSPRANVKAKLELCRRYAEGFGDGSGNLFITGDCGLGKTYLAACVAKTIVDKGFSVIYVSTFELSSNMEATRFERDNAAATELERYEKCDLLIIDDLGTEMTTSYSVAAFYNLMNRRMTGNKKTIIVTNLNPTEITTRYNRQIAARIESDYTVLLLYGDPVSRSAHRKKRL